MLSIWKDLVLAEDYIFEPWNHVNIEVRWIQDWAWVDFHDQTYILSWIKDTYNSNILDISTRSHLARVGLEVSTILSQGTFIFSMRNYGQATLALQRWYAIWRFYTYNNSLSGENLWTEIWGLWLIDSKFSIVNEEWQEVWEWSKNAKYLQMNVKSKGIRSPNSRTIIRIRQKKDYEEALQESHLTRGEVWLRISETVSPIHLSNNVALVIDTNPDYKWVQHLWSSLIDPWFSWPIVTEHYWESNWSIRMKVIKVVDKIFA